MSRLLGANGQALLTDEETALDEQVRAALDAFEVWQRTAGANGSPLILPALETIGRSCILSVFNNLPIGPDTTMLQQAMNLLLYECRKSAKEKARQAEIGKAVGDAAAKLAEDAAKGPTAGDAITKH